jgi:hypothetical protein
MVSEGGDFDKFGAKYDNILLRERSQITVEKNPPLKLNRVPKSKVKND